MLSTSPATYSALESRDVGPNRVISPPRDQGACLTCTAFVAVTAAEAAVASALGQDVDSVGRLSPQDLHYCGNDRLSCDTGATLKDTLAQLEKRQLLLEDCLRYQPPDMRGDATQQQLCARSCANTSPLASQGMFSFVRITQLWKAQQHIRKYGAVVTRFDHY
ncbi:hypothetical protein MNEG_13143, partial [Monoraphidium neglectum]